jgi:hypothetical protein
MPTASNALTRRSPLVALAVAVVLLALCQVAQASAAGSFTVNEVDKAGTTRQVGTWTYDTTGHTLVRNGAEASFVQALTSADSLGNPLPYVPFSGQDAFMSTTKMAVATKGFYVDDLAGWVAAQNGIPLGGTTTFNITCADTGGAFYWASPSTIANADGRYWYPSYNFSGTPATAAWDDSTRVERKAVLAIQSFSARRSAVTPANPTDYATLLTALGNLAATADDANSITIFMGQTKGAYDDLNLGASAAKWIDSLTFTPTYLAISANVGGGGGTGTVTTDDGYMKAAAGEPVSFTIGGITPGYAIGSVAVTDAAGGAVAVSDASGTYSFTMPASGASIKVSLVAPSPVDLAGASITAIPVQVYDGSPLTPPLVVTHGGAVLIAGIDYTIAYEQNVLLGAARATVTGIGSCTGAKSATFLIVPARAALKAVRAGRGKATVRWKPNGGGVSGYQVAYRNRGASSFRSAGKTSSLSKVVRSLRRGETCAFRVCAYKVIGGVTCRGSWSRTATVTIK